MRKSCSTYILWFGFKIDVFPYLSHANLIRYVYWILCVVYFRFYSFQIKLRRSKSIFTKMWLFTLISYKNLKLDPYFSRLSFFSAYVTSLRTNFHVYHSKFVIQAGKMVWSQDTTFDNPICWWNVHQAKRNHSRLSSYHFQMAGIYLCFGECKFNCSLMPFDFTFLKYLLVYSIACYKVQLICIYGVNLDSIDFHTRGLAINFSS